MATLSIGEIALAWLMLLAAGIAEIIFAVSLKFNAGFTRLIPSVVTLTTGGLSLFLLMTAIKVLPVGTAYAVWTGMGAVGVAILGIVLFKESVDIYRLISLSLVVLGIIGLKFTDAH
jgi:quaternary ammonium compound-resistance protein SugE